MNPLQALALIFNLLWVREVAQCESTVVQLATRVVLPARTQLVKVGHGVALDFIFAQLVQI